MTDGAALLRAVLLAPGALAPRLVYADWLMERGDPRGEFISAQCRGDEARAAVLLAAHGPRWRAGLAEDECEFHAGFPDQVVLAGPAAVEQWSAVVEESPVRRARLLGLTLSQLRQVLAWPGVERLEALDLSRGTFGNEGVEAIARCPALARLKELRLTSCNLGPLAARALASSEWLNGLERLDVSWNSLTVGGGLALARARGLRAVSQLRRFRTEMLEEVLEARFGPPCGPGPGLLCVELPPWVRTGAFTVGGLRALTTTPLTVGITPEADACVPSVLGGRRNSRFWLAADGTPMLEHLGHSLPIHINQIPWTGTQGPVGLRHGDLVEMPYRGTGGHPRPELRGLGLVYVGPRNAAPVSPGAPPPP